ncbi:hypothetical protein ACFQ07_09840, partial [Actinomadura adrarensis]
AGYAGDAVIACFRLLDSPQAKVALRDHPERELVTIISDGLFKDVVRHGFRGLRPADFREVRCEMPDKEFAETAWLHLPGSPTCQA